MILETFQNQPVVRLQSGDSYARITPAHGAKLLSWDLPDWSVVSWPDNANWDLLTKVRGGNPVLFPFIARTFANGHRGSWIDAEGVQRSAPMHGFAKDLPFHIIDAAEDFITIRLDSSEITLACYPFEFRFEVTHRLTPNSLLTTFRVTNRGQQPMPWSAGHHYYFHLPSAQRGEWQLTLPCQRWGRQDFADGSLHFEPALRDQAPVSDPTWIDRFQADPDFSRIRLHHPTSGRCLSFQNPGGHPDDWPCVTTWTENPESNFFCVEPWSAYPNAIHNGLGLRKLAPGDTQEISCRIHADILS
jgi:galactose mutarotase-like enzyme